MSLFNPYDDPLFLVLFTTKMTESGIVPIQWGHIDDSADRDLAGMSPDEARVAKRKFRKQWRKAAKQSVRSSKKMSSETVQRFIKDYMGKGNLLPTKKQRRNRRAAVFLMMRTEVKVAKAILTGETLGY